MSHHAPNRDDGNYLPQEYFHLLSKQCHLSSIWGTVLQHQVIPDEDQTGVSKRWVIERKMITTPACRAQTIFLLNVD